MMQGAQRAYNSPYVVEEVDARIYPVHLYLAQPEITMKQEIPSSLCWDGGTRDLL
jgi:hypothetical protein